MTISTHFRSRAVCRPLDKPAHGFTLVEMAIVLTIVGILLAGLLPMISGQIEQSRRNETRKYMDEVRDALLGYAIANKHLPCPDTDDDGKENTPCTAATFTVGKLPYNDLGVSDKDAYGKVLGYAVTNNFAASATLTLGITGAIPVGTSSGTSNLTSAAAALIVSHGANWATPTTEESVNDTGTPNFISKDFVQNGFDDLVVWISPNILFNRMVAAGQLP